MLSKFRFLLLFVFLSGAFIGSGQTAMDSLRVRLGIAAVLPDSIALLYKQLYIAPDESQNKILEDLYSYAVGHDDYNMVNDVLREKADFFASDNSKLEELLKTATKLPDSSEKDYTIAYIQILKNRNEARGLSEEEIEKRLRESILRKDLISSSENFKKIETLFQVIAYLKMSTRGELLTNNLKELQSLIDELPPRGLRMKYHFYRKAAETYQSNGLTMEAIAADKALLKQIEDITDRYSPAGKKKKDLKADELAAYNRLIRNYNVLPEEEIEEYYNRILTLSGEDVDPAAKVYYLMSKNKFAEAYPLLKQVIDAGFKNQEDRMYLVEALLRSAKAVGTKEQLHEALFLSNDMLKERIEKKATMNYKELQVVSEVNDLKAANEKLILDNRKNEMERHRNILIIAIIGIVLLGIFLAIVYELYRRSNTLTQNLTKSNALITEERDNLQTAKAELMEADAEAKIASRVKTDFIQNMSHEIVSPLESIVEYSGLIVDCADPDKREYIKRFADIIAVNTDLLLTLVNDVLELPSLEYTKLTARSAKISLQELCRSVLDSVESKVKPGVELIFANENDADTTIRTTPHRVEQVLLNLLTNSAYFTESGSITLQYELPSNSDTVVFSVADTGCGIPKGKENVIFSRFEKIDTGSGGKGLGLYISRLLAKLLGGSLKLDKEFTSGTKFIFTIPKS